jgi:hypothetical protein
MMRCYSKAWALAGALGAATAGAGIPESVHPDYTLRAVPFEEKHKVMGLDFLPDGRMVLATTDFIGNGEVPAAPSAQHKILLVSGVAGDKPEMTEIANNWLQIAGIVVADGKLYVSDRDGFYEILQLSAPSDLKANRRLVMKWPDDGSWNANGFQWHQWVFTPMYRQGWFYAPYSGSIRYGGPSNVEQTNPYAGAFLKWDSTGKVEKLAGGFRSPNGADLDEATGDMMVADNQGSWLPASTVALMKPGKFYGHSNVSSLPTSANWAESLPYEPPVAWLPHRTVRASPSQPVAFRSGAYAGHWLLGDVNHPGLVRIAVDKVGDSPANGAVFWFSNGTLNAAINRMAWGPDGALYIGTLMTIAGNWPGGDKKDFYRLAPKAAAAAFEMKAVRSLKDGLEVEFTSPVDPATATAANFAGLKMWEYKRMEAYGEGKQADQSLAVSGTSVSADGRRVHLVVAGLAANRVIYFKASNVKGAGGKAPWNDEVWFTLNTVSPRTWDPSVGVRPGGVSLLEGRVDHRVSAGQVLVDIRSEGPWRAALLSPDGKVLAAAAGNGPSSFRLSAGRARAGLHLLRLSGREGSTVRKVML